MEFKEGSNTGQNNSFNETNLGDNSQYIDNPGRVTINNNGPRSARIAKDYARLRDEIGKEVDSKTKDKVKFYETKIPGTKDVIEKLTDGGFKPSRIREAERLKEFWGKEALRYADYPYAQDINFVLYTRIVREFEVYITPMVEDGEPLRDIMVKIHEQIVKPIVELLECSGEDDENLRYTYDHIYGIIYYLTGNCHLNWKDYDDDNV